MLASLLGPLELPTVIATEEVIFLNTAGTCVFQNQVEEHIAGRIGVIFRIVSNLDRVHPVPVLQEVIERYSFSADTQERESQLIQGRFSPCEANVELGDGSV